MPAELSTIPYKHRSNAASLLISKANRLTGLTGQGSTETPPNKIKNIRAGIAYYEMALILLKPYDPNYCTILNWKCLALLKLSQFADATRGYEEILSICAATEGNNASTPYTQLASEKIREYTGRTNQDLPPEDDDADVFDTPPYCAFGEDFVGFLRDASFKKAHACLSDPLREEISLAKLKSDWLSLIAEGRGEPVEITAESHTTDWPARTEQEIAWCYYSITNSTLNEAIIMTVGKTKHDGFEITSFELGRQ